MIKSGITWRIDELGRIVVPKEIRYNLGIRDGEPLEIYTSDNSIIIKKYSQVENIKNISAILCEIFNQICGIEVIITDREKVIATDANNLNLIDYKLNDELKSLIDNRETLISDKEDNLFDKTGYFVMLPIITSIDSSGLVIVFSKNNSNENLKYAKLIQKLLIQKLDI